jgi:hypothetical protein
MSNEHIRELTWKELDVVQAFAKSEGVKAERNYFEDILYDKNTVFLGYFNKDNFLIGMTSATLFPNFAYGSMLHCKRSETQYTQMSVLCRLLDELEEIVKAHDGRRLLMSARNLYDQIQRRGFKIYKDGSDFKVFSKELNKNV